MKPSHAILALLCMASATASAQVVPDVNRPKPLPVSGTLRYDLRYSQTAQFYGGGLGDTQSSVVSGDLTYANLSQSRPFSVTYSGGDMWNISGGSYGSGVFQHMLVSQGLLGRKWQLSLTDDASYMPQSPTGGFSGIPGVGDLPQPPNAPSQPILTLNTRSVFNSVSPSFSHVLNHATSLSFNGSYGIVRYPDGNGLETNQIEAGSQISRRLNALNSISGQYSYSHFSYPDYTITMGTQSAQFGFQRTWSRRLRTAAMGGPEWVQGSSTLAIPSSTNFAASANVTYDAGLTSANLNYSRAASGGAGSPTLIGVHNDDISVGLSRQFGKNLSVSATGAFMRTRGLQQSGVTNGKTGGASATQRLGRYITASINYSALQQSSSAVLPTNAISGLSQVIGFSIGYSPREMHFKK
jgi:hypothetical protein